MNYLTYVCAALMPAAWMFRGGSLWGNANYPAWLTVRPIEIAATPLLITAALLLHASTAIEMWAAIGGGWFIAAASVDGWKNTTDLGRDGDRTTKAELSILYLRLSQFIPASVPLYFYHPVAALIPASILIAPLWWWLEKVIWFQRDKAPPFAVVEFMIGLMLGITTIITVTIK